MALIEIRSLRKSYRVYQKKEGLAASLKSLFRRQYRDVHAEEMRAVIDTKIAAQPSTAPTGESAAVMHLLDALKQSVAIAQADPATATSKFRTSRRRASK